MRLASTALVVFGLTVTSLGTVPPAAATQPQAPATQDACYDYKATGTKAQAATAPAIPSRQPIRKAANRPVLYCGELGVPDGQA